MSAVSRRLSRHSAAQALYQWLVTKQSPGDIEGRFISDSGAAGSDLSYFVISYCISTVSVRIESPERYIDPERRSGRLVPWGRRPSSQRLRDSVSSRYPVQRCD